MPLGYPTKPNITPSPWLIDDQRYYDSSYRIVTVETGSARTVATAFGEEDARAISATPELIDALLECLPLVQTHGEFQFRLRVKAALRKAGCVLDPIGGTTQ